MPHDEATQAAPPPAECLACPICAGLRGLRQARPEVVDHLVKAAAELLLAVRALVEPVAAGDGRAAGAPAGAPAGDGRPRRAGGMQHIDVG